MNSKHPRIHLARNSARDSDALATNRTSLYEAKLRSIRKSTDATAFTLLPFTAISSGEADFTPFKPNKKTKASLFDRDIYTIGGVDYLSITISLKHQNGSGLYYKYDPQVCDLNQASDVYLLIMYAANIISFDALKSNSVRPFDHYLTSGVYSEALAITSDKRISDFFITAVRNSNVYSSIQSILQQHKHYHGMRDCTYCKMDESRLAKFSIFDQIPREIATLADFKRDNQPDNHNHVPLYFPRIHDVLLTSLSILIEDEADVPHESTQLQVLNFRDLSANIVGKLLKVTTQARIIPEHFNGRYVLTFSPTDRVCVFNQFMRLMTSLKYFLFKMSIIKVQLLGSVSSVELWSLNVPISPSHYTSKLGDLYLPVRYNDLRPNFPSFSIRVYNPQNGLDVVDQADLLFSFVDYMHTIETIDIPKTNEMDNLQLLTTEIFNILAPLINSGRITLDEGLDIDDYIKSILLVDTSDLSVMDSRSAISVIHNDKFVSRLPAKIMAQISHFRLFQVDAVLTTYLKSFLRFHLDSRFSMNPIVAAESLVNHYTITFFEPYNLWIRDEVL